MKVLLFLLITSLSYSAYYKTVTSILIEGIKLERKKDFISAEKLYREFLLFNATHSLSYKIEKRLKNLPERWAQDKKTGCKLLYKNPAFSLSFSWSGKCLNGFGEGQGELLINKNNRLILKYVGDLQNGKLHGQGKNYKDGIMLVYSGQFINGQENGFGIAYRVDGSKWYEGPWKNGQPHGIGKDFNTKNEVIYEGRFIHGNRKEPKTQK
ncbi:MAG: hypothetical protein COB02_17430 [Candidatus Cloacimonadota bacterium]|nr:MAG: hypothetical protein COB02_17430 [Candidatus Cloacimonadota bacterium]